MTDGLHSAFYEGTVRHRRHGDVEHTFSYQQSLLYLDLDEVDALMGQARLWSSKRPAPGRFKRSDYHGEPDTPLPQAIRDTVEQQTGTRPEGPIRLLARARAFGHVFNPVTFAYCFDPSGVEVQSVMAEVTNTPWGESHAYVLSAHEDGSTTLREQMDKVFHVSPLMGMDHRYDVRVTTPGERLAVNIASTRNGEPAFDATLLLARRELTPSALDRSLLRRPAESLRALALIYAHALALRLKGARWYPHPEKTS